jgi:cell wall-associated NlpC family hydrolase
LLTIKKNAIDKFQFGEPERGAFVFYDCLCQSEDGIVNWGHCGISLGKGQVIHAWSTVRIDDFRQIEQLTSPIGEHPRYIGWVPLRRVLSQPAEMISTYGEDDNE